MRMKIVATAVALLALTVCPAAHARDRVSLEGFGKVRIGMSERELARALGPTLTREDPLETDARCYYLTSNALPESVAMMIYRGQLEQFDVYAPGTATVSGAEVGMAEGALRRLSGDRFNEEPHKYAYPEGRYLTLYSADGARAIRFETDGQVVTRFYAGTAESISLSEGCQ